MRSIRFVMALAAILAVGAAQTARAASAEGEKIYKETCTGCHGPGQHPLDEVRLSRAKWKEELERMEGLGASIPGGKKQDELLDWLAETHGPATGPGGGEKK